MAKCSENIDELIDLKRVNYDLIAACFMLQRHQFKNLDFFKLESTH